LELRDLLVTPILLVLVYVIAYMVRPFVTDGITKAYFIPALTVRIIGALAVGLMYQFYYNGGDTYNYHTHGSRHIWNAFVESPETGLKLLFADGTTHVDIYKYSSRIPFFTDWNSYNVIRVATVFDLITFSTYSATAVLFAVFSFAGVWLFFQTFYQQYPHLHRGLAIAAFFIPSVVFWGSGLLKDTLALSFLCFSTYLTYTIFIKRQATWWRYVLLAFVLYALYSIKAYILLNFLPAAILWVFLKRLSFVSSPALKATLFPFVIIGAFSFGFYAVNKASEDNPRYSMNKIAETARITAYDIRFYTGKEAGSGYTLGELDGSFASMLSLAPEAINASLFRPYLWEASNLLMLFSALESFVLLMMVLFILMTARFALLRHLRNPDIVFALIFSISFAFAVGVSTFNFGTLARYKIPLMPFFILALILLHAFSNRDKKLRLLEETE
jgi:hypothetical protein